MHSRRKIAPRALASTLAVWAALAAAGAARAQSPVTLALKLEKGAVYDITFAAESRTVQTISRKETVTTHTMAFALRYTVEDVAPDGIMTVRAEYTAASIASSLDGKTTRGDSAAAKITSRDDAFCKALVGRTLTLELGPDGVCKTIKGAKELLAQITDSIVRNTTLPRADVERSIHPGNPDALVRSLTPDFAFYPDKPVHVGDTWKVPAPAATPAAELTAALTSIKDNIATLTIDGKTRSPQTPATPPKVGDSSVTLQDTGTHSSRIEIDLATGVPTSATMSYAANGTVESRSTSGTWHDTWPIQTRSSATVTMKRAK